MDHSSEQGSSPVGLYSQVGGGRQTSHGIDKELLGLLFDNDILFEVSQNMCRAVLKYVHTNLLPTPVIDACVLHCRKITWEKNEEDLYVLDKNLGE